METSRRSIDKIQAIVLQPTPQCNINCSYCYLPERTVHRPMSSAVLTRILEAVFSSPLLDEELHLLWHAGEPLLMPLDFYRETLALVERLNTRGVKVVPMLQTNGMLLTQEWCDFIREQRVHVSISVDGPQHIHDRSRVYRSGKGTFAQTVRGIRLLQENGIKPGVLIVLTKYALDYPDEIWQFFVDYQLTSVSLNIEEVNGAHRYSSLENDEGIEDKYKRFLRRIFELKDKSRWAPTIREIEAYEYRIANMGDDVVQSQENIAGKLVSFDSLGNMTTFASELLTTAHPRYGDFLLGNIFDGTLEELFAGPKFIAIDEEVQRGVKHCERTCNYFGFCGGGSPANKFSEHGRLDGTETLYCKLKIQATMDVVIEHREQAIDSQA